MKKKLAALALAAAMACLLYTSLWKKYLRQIPAKMTVQQYFLQEKMIPRTEQ